MPKKKISRRDFMTTATAGGILLTAGAPAVHSQEMKKAAEKVAAKMPSRQIGKTGLKGSQLCMGGGGLPTKNEFDKLIDHGMNMIDTSSDYMRGNSEIGIAKLMEGVSRDKVIITTKFHPTPRGRRGQPSAKASKEDLIKELEDSLERLKTDHVEFILIHGASSAEQVQNEIAYEAFQQLKKDGKARFFGLSTHQNAIEVCNAALKQSWYSMFLISYNVFQRMGGGKRGGDQGSATTKYDDFLKESKLDQVIAKAYANGIAVEAMKVMAGGDSQKLDKYMGEGITEGQAKLMWAYENPAVCSLVVRFPGRDGKSYVDENLAAVSKKLTTAGTQRLYERSLASAATVCRMCGNCAKACPRGVAVPQILRYTMYHKGYGLVEEACAKYNSLHPSERVTACDGCGKCEQACPYGVEVMNQLQEASRTLC